MNNLRLARHRHGLKLSASLKKAMAETITLSTTINVWRREAVMKNSD